MALDADITSDESTHRHIPDLIHTDSDWLRPSPSDELLQASRCLV